MRIGLVSFYSHNYGGLLQAFSLQTVLESFGCTVEGINRGWAAYGYNMWSQSRSLKERIKKAIVDTPFDDFVKDNIHLSEPVMNFDHLQKMSTRYDAIIAGSDQIWNADCLKHMGYYFFLDWVSPQCRKLSYAASFGLDRFNAEEEQIVHIKEYLKTFGFVSVRERSGVSICKQIFQVESMQVLDPTMLLPKDFWLKIANYRGEIKNTLCSYFLDSNPIKNELLESLCNSLMVINVPNNTEPYSFLSQVFNKQHRMPTVQDWLRNIAESKFVITDSFHGTVFAILFEKQFVCLNNEQRGSTRFESLLNIFDLSDRLVSLGSSSNEQIKSVMLRQIDYHRVKEVLASNRDYSIECLLHGLGREL